METLIGDGQAGARPGDPIKNTTTETFMADVIEASMHTPVIVDFWAPWCGPCKTLGPILEKCVAGAGGAVRMVKLNIDDNPEVAQQLRVQSIPTVFAFKDGRPLDGFTGALPESQVRQFIDRVVHAAGGEGKARAEAVKQALERAKQALDAGDGRAAGALFSQVLQADPSRLEAAAGLIRSLIAVGELAAARQHFDQLPEETRDANEMAAAKTALELAEQNADSVARLPELQARLEANPDDQQARLDLASAQFASGQQESAINALLDMFRRDREWSDQAARVQLLKFFEALGPTHPLTVRGRRKLSSMLFS